MRAIASSVLNVGGVSGTGTIHLGHTAGTGTLHIGYDGEGYNSGAVINANAITTGTGTGTVLFGTSATKASPYYLTKDATSSGTFVAILGATQVQQIDGYNVLGGASTYTGGTTISGGTLVAASTGALGVGTVQLNGGTLSVNSGVTLTNPLTFTVGGGTLSGTGTFGSAATIGSNVHIAPGNSVGTVNFSNGLTLAGGGTLDFEVQSAGTGYDLVSVSGGPLNITATSANRFTLKIISLNLSGTPGPVNDFSSASSYAWIFATSAAGITGFDPNAFDYTTAGSFSNSLGVGKFFFTQSGNNLILNFTPVPEPSTYALILAGLAVAGLGYRRRKNRSS
jgi:autotransporter-associated beta strand protein